MVPGTPQPLSKYAEYLITRSPIPKVVGILAIIFAAIGAMGSAIWTWGPLDDLSRWDETGSWHALVIWLWAWGLTSAFLFALHLVAGIFALLYRPAAPRLITIYAVAAVLLAVLDVALMLGMAPNSGIPHYHAARDSVVTTHLVFSVLALAWPITAGILMNTARAKRACVIPPR